MLTYSTTWLEEKKPEACSIARYCVYLCCIWGFRRANCISREKTWEE